MNSLDSEKIADIDALLQLGIGDEGRLYHMKTVLKQDRQLYNSDSKYLAGLKQRLVENSVHQDTKNHNETATRVSEDIKEKPKEDVPSVSSSDDVLEKNIVIINQPRQSSAAWYLLPVFFSIIGGAISYLCLRKQDPPRARKTLILGALLSILPILMLVGILGIVHESFEDTKVSVPEMTDEQIRQNALVVPYDSLLAESQRYQGEIIQYEGDVVQVMDNFNSYMLRVEVSDELFVTNSVWSNFVPDTDEQSMWVQDIEKKHDPFGQDPDRVKIWGLFTGLKDYDTLLGSTVTVPEVDVYLLEKIP